MSVNYTKLSKIVSHALRHEPASYDLILDKDGWAEIDNLLLSLRTKDKVWSALSHVHLEQMIKCGDKKRHQIRDSKIRAVYGHSIQARIEKKVSVLLPLSFMVLYTIESI